jgi:hypothetical protein
MGMELYRNIVDQAADIPQVSEMCLTGLGEPLLDKHLRERLHYLRRKLPAIPLSLYTNGSYLTREAAGMLRRADALVYVSLNAANQDKRRQVMGLEDYDDVVRNIDVAIADGTRIKVKAVCEKDLIEGEEVDEFKDRWGDRAFLHQEGNWAGATWPMRTKHERPCSRALTQIMVLWDGRVSLCCFDGEGEVILGDLRKQTIREVFNGELALKYRTFHMEGRRQELPLCAGCTVI